MIALVAGEVSVRRPDHVVIETASGVGYRLAVSAETLRQVPAAGETVSLLTHLVVREDALSLFGFATEEERDLFLLLIGVQGVGPKMAQAVLSGGSPRELIGSVAAGDVKRTASDSSRLLGDAGWEARVGLEEGLASQLAWAMSRQAFDTAPAMV